jgi:hypothetical protein
MFGSRRRERIKKMRPLPAGVPAVAAEAFARLTGAEDIRTTSDGAQRIWSGGRVTSDGAVRATSDGAIRAT